MGQLQQRGAVFRHAWARTAPPPRQESVVALAPGATVLLLTDGLIERRDGTLDTGMARLRTAAAGVAGRSLDEPCDELVQRLVDGRPEDDVALVAIRLRGPAQP